MGQLGSPRPLRFGAVCVACFLGPAATGAVIAANLRRCADRDTPLADVLTHTDVHARTERGREHGSKEQWEQWSK
jgi:hypothetical protein